MALVDGDSQPVEPVNLLGAVSDSAPSCTKLRLSCLSDVTSHNTLRTLVSYMHTQPCNQGGDTFRESLDAVRACMCIFSINGCNTRATLTIIQPSSK